MSIDTQASRRNAMDAFLKDAGWADAVRDAIPGDASTRRYVRLRRGGQSAIVMDQPQNAESAGAPADATPETRRALGYNALARLAGADCARFVAAARYLRESGLAAPDIYHDDSQNGFLLIEDLGDDLYTDVIARGASEADLYGASIDALAALHIHPAPLWLAPGKALFAYDETALVAETDLLTELFIPMRLGRPADESEMAEHRVLWRKALHDAVHAKPVFVHRDFHAQNLLWRSGEHGLARVGVLDFQDAVAGSPAYDLISLLEDARRDVSPDLAEAMTKRYLARSRNDGGAIEEESFRAQAAILAAQRNAKIIGIFARLAQRDAKPRYLAHLPRVWRYMERDLTHPALSSLKKWYDRVIPEEARTQPMEPIP